MLQNKQFYGLKNTLIKTEKVENPFFVITKKNKESSMKNKENKYICTQL